VIALTCPSCDPRGRGDGHGDRDGRDLDSRGFDLGDLVDGDAGIRSLQVRSYYHCRLHPHSPARSVCVTVKKIINYNTLYSIFSKKEKKSTPEKSDNKQTK
jgi:hypothetical protein